MLHLTRRTKIQFVIFVAIALVAIPIMLFGYMRAPAYFGIGRYTVTVELSRAAGLYPRANVTYRGTEIGRVETVHLTESGVSAVLSLQSDIPIAADVEAQVHSQSAIGEQYVALNPRDTAGPPLKDGDVIPMNRTSVPPDINSLLEATNRGLEAIPQESLKTVIDESYAAVGGLGPELARLVKGSTQLAIDAGKHLDSIVTLIDQSKPVLDSQTDTADAVTAWASNLATITGELKNEETDVAGLIHSGAESAVQGRQLIERLQPTLPVLLANLVSVGQVAVTYQPAIEQVLVLLPQSIAMLQATAVPNLNTKQDYQGLYLDFHLNLNLPPTCSTGFLPAQQQRAASLEDYPERIMGDIYCRVPQNSPFNVRGVRNYPCLTVPGKRAPTVKMCESDEQYVPLNDGYNWKGDPNATLSGQDVPQRAGGAQEAVPPAAPEPAAVAVVPYDSASGTYIGPDGRRYTQSDLGQVATEQTWQSMLVPPTQ